MKKQTRKLSSFLFSLVRANQNYNKPASSVYAVHFRAAPTEDDPNPQYFWTKVLNDDLSDNDMEIEVLARRIRQLSKKTGTPPHIIMLTKSRHRYFQNKHSSIERYY